MSNAAEMLDLPWDLLTLRPREIPIGAIDRIVVTCTWPESIRVPDYTPVPVDRARALLVWSNAGGRVPIKRHVAALEDACRRGGIDFNVQRDVIGKATTTSLRNALTAGPRPVSLLHVCCFNKTSLDGTQLLFDDEQGGVAEVSDKMLQQALEPALGDLKVVTLCTGNTFGHARRLHRFGAPWVVGWLDSLEKRTAAAFAEEFLGRLVGERATVEQAFASARHRLALDAHSGRLGNVVLYSRVAGSGIAPLGPSESPDVSETAGEVPKESRPRAREEQIATRGREESRPGGERRSQRRRWLPRWLGRVPVPEWAVYGLGGLVLVFAVALPWLARSQGYLRYQTAEAPPQALHPALIELPEGTFLMGSEEYPNEQPVHQVTVSAFQLCRTEVTQAQYEAVMGENPSICRYGCEEDAPVQQVSWLDAVRYLNQLSRLAGLTEDELCYVVQGEQVTWRRSCVGYRLPTEAEWEYAARAGTRTRYSFGDDEGRLDEHAWYAGKANKRVHPVARKGQNPWGFHDMHGNVWEWVWDWYSERYSTDTGNDPMGPKTGDRRVLRGGSFGVAAVYLRSAHRNRDPPSHRYGFFGFRCARGVLPASTRRALDP